MGATTTQTLRRRKIAAGSAGQAASIELLLERIGRAVGRKVARIQRLRAHPRSMAHDPDGTDLVFVDADATDVAAAGGQ